MDEVINKLLDSVSAAAHDAAASRGKGGRRGQRGCVAAASSAKRPTLVKVGEGSYGEAWRLGGDCGRGGKSGGTSMVIKVVPIEGSILYNGSPQVRLVVP